GPQSALYISWGSLLFPQKYIDVLIHALLEQDQLMPFVFAASSWDAVLPPSLKEEVDQSGRGIIVHWAPQQAVPAHPALGWMLTHCGSGGMSECLTRGVPLLAWPLFWDQPAHALWLSQVLDVAFEFLQVREGPVKGLAYRAGGLNVEGTREAVRREVREVLGMCRGEEGRRKRENALRVRGRVWEAVGQGGQVQRHLEELGRFLWRGK
ncbi:UDP-Glycosyltransferase/glycogen phosphorylase, partial [Dacryopinax primogenitus]